MKYGMVASHVQGLVVLVLVLESFNWVGDVFTRT